MNVQCPHCGASFAVAQDRAQSPDASVTCPECLTGFGLSEAQGGDSGELDLDFDLDALSSIGIEDSRHGNLSASGLDLGGFDEDSMEVSHLSDVDLTMAGTYHRTGRKIHHATDVVWTDRRQAPNIEAAPIPDSALRSEAAPKRNVIKDGLPPLGTPSPPPTTESSVRRQAFIDAPTMSAFPPLDDGDDGDAVDLPDLESPGPGAPATSMGNTDGLGDVAGEEATAMLEEMDFSSLLEDSLSGSKSLFGQDSNPFLDVGITGDSVSHKIEEEADDGGALFESDDDTNTFFIEAPSVATSDSPKVDDPGGFDISGTFELDVGGDAGHSAAHSQSPPPRGGQDLAPSAVTERGATTRRAPSSGKSSNKGAIAILGVLAVLVGLGVAAEALQPGFFEGLMGGSGEEGTQPQGGDNTEIAGQGGDTGEVAPGVEKPPVPKTVVDTPKAFDLKVAEISTQLQATPDDAKLKNTRLVLQLQYRYRWPGRFKRDEARKTELTALMAEGGGSSVEANFWDLLGRYPVEGQTRAELLRKADVVITQINMANLPKGRGFLYKAVLFREQGKRESALGLLKLAVEEAPDDTWALFELAKLQLEMELLDDADATLDNLLRLVPEHRDGVLLAALVALGRQTPDAYARARQLTEQAHIGATEDGDAYGEWKANVLRARVYGLQNDLGKRLEALEGAAKYDPDDEGVLLELADNDLKAGKAEKAAQRLKGCSASVCKSARYFKTHMKILYVSHDLQGAEGIMAAADKKFQDNPELLFWGGRILEARGKLPLAAQKYELVRQKDSKYLEAYLRLAGIHRREKKFDKAILVLKEASKVFEGAGKDSVAAIRLMQESGELLIKQGRLEQAREVFNKIVAAQPTNAPARVRLATLLTDLGYPEKAVPHFEKLYEQGKSDPEVNIKFAEALIRSGKPDRAIEELKTFLGHNPKSLAGLVKLGHAYVQKQRYEEAMAVLEHAVAINQNYAPAYFFAGKAELGRQRQKAEEVERQRRSGAVVKDENRPNFTKAIIALSTAKEKDKENLEYRKVLAEALTESGRERNLVAALEQYDVIIKAYEHAQRVNRPIKREGDVYYRRGLLASKLGMDRAKVLDSFEQALVLQGDRADFIARYAEELYKRQYKRKVDNRYVLEAKAYFQLVLNQHNSKHVRANYYMGHILLHEWDRQRQKRAGDALHKAALDHFLAVVSNHGGDEFPDAHMNIGNIYREQNMRRVSNTSYQEYLDTYRRIHHRDPPNGRYIRDLMRQR